MKLEYVPLLPIQRELHNIPRSPARFDEYLRTILNDDRTDVELVPLLLMNPMGKDHVTALLDALLALHADGIAARTFAEASARLAAGPGAFKAAVVVADDLMGGWTNRWAYEYDLRRPGPGHKRFWVTGILWSSEPAPERVVRREARTTRSRTAEVQRRSRRWAL